MTSKERAKLKSEASKTDTILQMGKNPMGAAFIKQVRDALKARELIKIRVLETCEMLPVEAAQAICEEIDCEVVQVIGSRIVLFKRRSKDDRQPSLLDDKKHEKTTASEIRSDRNNHKGERKSKKNEQYKSGYGKSGRSGSGSGHIGQKNGKKSGNIRRSF